MLYFFLYFAILYVVSGSLREMGVSRKNMVKTTLHEISRNEEGILKVIDI